MNNIEAMKLALEALEIVTREMLALRDELAERGGRPKKGIRQLLWDSSHKVYTDTAIPAAEALRQAIEQAQLVQRAEDAFERYEAKSDKCLMENAQGDLERVKLVQTGVGIGEPEFTTHAVENAYDWSEWVCPDPTGYLMKCCDCGLVHEAEFKVVRYKSETEREDCEPVDDTNVQAVFRMRRSEQWSPEDMAHRAGGLPMEQAQQVEPVTYPENFIDALRYDTALRDFEPEQAQKQEPVAWMSSGEARMIHWKSKHPCFGDDWIPLYTSPPTRQWVGLTDEEICPWFQENTALTNEAAMRITRAIEAKIKEKNNV